MFDMRKIQEQVLFGAVASASGEQTAAAIVHGNPDAPEDNAAWVNAAMARLTSRFDTPAVKSIRMRCQCGYGMEEKLALIQELMQASSSLEEFGALEESKAAGLYYENGELYLQFMFCPCPMLAEVDRLQSYAWCQCTTGYSKVLFEKAFGCEVDVELLKSIKAGDDRCLMKISPKGTVF